MRCKNKKASKGFFSRSAKDEGDSVSRGTLGAVRRMQGAADVQALPVSALKGALASTDPIAVRHALSLATRAARDKPEEFAEALEPLLSAAAKVGQCKLDPGLKAPGFKSST